MSLKQELNNSKVFFNIQVLASQIVEGFITGIHKSPFHGFSSEFAEHKVYNNGESTKHIDWKLYARTDKLYTKRYEEETNLRCHFIIDNSASMHFPKQTKLSLDSLNKIGFSALACAAIMELLKKQRDAVGLSLYGNDYEFYTSEKGSERHFSLILNELEKAISSKPVQQDTNTVKYLHEIAEQLKRRSLVFYFTDLFQFSAQKEDLFNALRHLKHNNHRVVLFHTLQHDTEINFNYNNTPQRFVDVETGDSIQLFADEIKEQYQKSISEYLKAVALECAKYRIKYIPVDIDKNFSTVLNTYLTEKQNFG